MAWAVSLIMAGQNPSPHWQRYEQSQVHMGTTVRIAFYASDEATATRAAGMSPLSSTCAAVSKTLR